MVSPMDIYALSRRSSWSHAWRMAMLRPFARSFNRLRLCCCSENIRDETDSQTGSEFSAANMLAQSSALIHPSSEFMHLHADRMHANFIFMAIWIAIKLAHLELTLLNWKTSGLEKKLSASLHFADACNSKSKLFVKMYRLCRDDKRWKHIFMQIGTIFSSLTKRSSFRLEHRTIGKQMENKSLLGQNSESSKWVQSRRITCSHSVRFCMHVLVVWRVRAFFVLFRFVWHQ